MTKPFIENFEYLISQKINFNNFMTLTSSNRLVRQAPKFESQNIQLVENKIIQDINVLVGWVWPNFLENKDIVKIFQDNKKIINGQVSGRLYSKNVMEKICEFIRVNKIMDLIKKETVFEEIIFPSLAYYYMNAIPELYCHTFWNIPSTIPNVDDVKQILKERPHIYIIKRFPEDLNHILFKTFCS